MSKYFFTDRTKMGIFLLAAIGLFIYILLLNERIASLKQQNEAYSSQMKSLRVEQAELKDKLAANQKEYKQQLELISNTYLELTKLPTDESIIQKMPVPLNSGNNWDEILRPIELTLHGDTLLR